MINKRFTYVQKVDNESTLSAQEWNNLAQDVVDAVDAINNNTNSAIDTAGVVSVNSKGNTTISATKNINIEPAYVEGGGSGTYGDVLIKPGDDITLESHHRETSKRDEITIKTSNGQSGNNKAPVKLQLVASDVTLSTKGKLVDPESNDLPNVMNVRVTTGDGKGYLKVRAQAIDLRCEDHGGIALQPKGTDGQGHENKIKFEHGGGDGLEFGTFNTEKTSIFTNEYRFNKNGIWKMATRTKTVSDKMDVEDPTTAQQYVKQSDDFYDVINPYCDVTATTEGIIKAGKFFDIDTIIGSDGIVETALLLYRPNISYQEDALKHTLNPMINNGVPTHIANLPVYDGTTEYSFYELYDSLINIFSSEYLFTLLYNPDVQVKCIDDLMGTFYYSMPSNKGDIVKVKLLDIIKLVNYFKTNNQGPWTSPE